MFLNHDRKRREYRKKYARGKIEKNIAKNQAIRYILLQYSIGFPEHL